MTPHRLRVNTLIQFRLEGTLGEGSQGDARPRHLVERVLYLDPTRTYAELIDVDNKKAWNHQRRCEDIFAALECGDAVVLPHDYKLRRITADQLNERERAKGKKGRAIAKAVETRDHRWALIGHLVTNHVPDIFDRKKRGQLVRELLKQTGRKDKSTILDSIRRFWQGGQVQDALCGDYRLCGSQKQSETGAKRGPKSSGVASPGVARTPEVRAALASGVHRFLKGTGRGHVDAAFDATIETFFFDEMKDPISGKKVRYPLPPSQRPTKRQFRTQIAEERALTPVLVTKHQLGEHEYNRNARATVGSSEDLSWGAGTLYMFDWTVLPFPVLHPYRYSDSLGYPTGYAAVDFSTWLIPGVNVTLERGSWLGGMEACEITFTEKVSFCAEFDYPLAGPAAWPADIVPDQIYADGGEFKTRASNVITSKFHTTLANEPPYRPDLKALVEAYFALVKEEIFWTLPGVAPRNRRRGERDPRLDAVLTMRLAMWIMIDFALWHNSNFLIPVERMPRAALEDGVKRHPLDLWNWSVSNESGSGRQYERDYVQKCLLPRHRARVDGSGIWLDGLTYTCARAEREQWFDRAAATRPWYVDVAREPRRMGTLFLDPGAELPYEPCGLAGRFRRYSELTLEEWLEHRKASKQEARDEHAHRQTKRIVRRRAWGVLVRRARRKRDAYLRKVGKTPRALTKGIQGHRRAERTRMRRRKAWFRSDDSGPLGRGQEPAASSEQQTERSTPVKLGVPPETHRFPPNALGKPDEPTYIASPTQIDALRRARTELRTGKQNGDSDLTKEGTAGGKV